ncbi:hypothetical protein HMPREF9406_3673 [Clostridium sp. HGF2]|nr:hypothetical protein HMPREF9406_3673 [Clostridium sp. HGF2]EQJ55856.1 hypothetical protein QSI_2502 [Clostridioides difficile P28]
MCLCSAVKRRKKKNDLHSNSDIYKKRVFRSIVNRLEYLFLLITGRKLFF